LSNRGGRFREAESVTPSRIQDKEREVERCGFHLPFSMGGLRTCGGYILGMKKNRDSDRSASTHMPALTSAARPVSSLSRT